MSLPKLLAILGVILFLLGLIFAFAPAAQEVWEPKSHLLVSETVDVSPYFGYSRSLTYYFFKPEDVRNLRIQGYVEGVAGNVFSFEITDGKVYVRAEGVSRKDFNFLVEPEELRDGLQFKIEPSEAKASIYVKALWEEKTYAHILGGLILGGFLGFLGVMLLVAAFILHLVRRPRVEVVVEKKTS